MALLQNVIGRGTHASRPAAGSAGILYFETDTGQLFRDSGSAWQLVDLSALFATKGDLLVGTGSGTVARLAAGTDAYVLTADSAQTDGIKWAAAAGAASLSTASAFLGGNFTLTSANTYYDVLSLSLAAGTWAVWGGLTFANGTAANNLLTRVWDGTTATTALETTNANAGFQMSTTIMALLTPGSTTSYKLSAACQTSAGTVIYATPNVLATGLTNLASWFYGIKIG